MNIEESIRMYVIQLNMRTKGKSIYLFAFSSFLIKRYDNVWEVPLDKVILFSFFFFVMLFFY